MALKITRAYVSDGPRLVLIGRLTIGDTDTLRTFVHDAIEAGDRSFTLDLAGLSYVDSAGLGEIARALASVRQAGGDLRLENVPPRVQELLAVTGLIKAFQLPPRQLAA